MAEEVDALKAPLEAAIKAYATARVQLPPYDEDEIFTPEKTVVVGWVLGIQIMAFSEDGKPGDDLLPVLAENMSSYAAVGLSRILAVEVEDDARGMNVEDED